MEKGITSHSVVYGRTVLRICSAFRIVSDDTTFVFSGVMPIHILADKVTNIYKVKSISANKDSRKEERERKISV